MARSLLSPRPLASRLDALDWRAIESDLWAHGYARTPRVLSHAECAGLARLYDDDSRFRSRVDMRRHGFGSGEYKYFAAPLPAIVAGLRRGAYPPLAAVANRWMQALGSPLRYPASLRAFLARCAAHGQTKPTPLLLRYGAGDYNCLHRDLYGEVAFPLQVLVVLSRPAVDYQGGAFLLVEQRPRAQSVGEAIVPGAGELVIFTNNLRPVRGRSGFHRTSVRHGMSRLLSGRRLALGVIFHDAL
jgi:uncharacterized protein